MNNFNRSNLQSPATYFKGQGLKLTGGLHAVREPNTANPSLSENL